MGELFFPYEKPRPEQWEIMKKLSKALEERKSCIFEAPSGIGKTIAVLSVVLPYALREGLRVFYACRTHTQMSRVIEELKVMNQRGFEVKGVMLRGRGEMCFIEYVRRLPYRQMIKLCERLRRGGRCPYDLHLREKISEIRALDVKVHHSEDIVKLARELGVCPYGLALELARRAEIITLSYLYLLDRDLRQILLRVLEGDLSKSIVILDEAHNIFDVAMEVESSTLTLRTINHALKSLRKIRVKVVEPRGRDIVRMKYALNKGLRVIGRILERRIEGGGEREYPAYEFIKDFEITAGESLLVFIDWLSEYLHMISRRTISADLGYLEMIRDFLERLIDTQNDERYIHVLGRAAEGAVYSVLCLDPQVALKPLLSEVYASIHMSATLSPLREYAEVAGLERGLLFSVKPSYHGRVAGVIITGVTTAYEERSEEMYSRIASAISVIAEALDCNIAVFAPSYEVLENVVSRLRTSKKVFVEERGESTSTLEAKIREFKNMWREGGAILAGVLGGRACEGVDYPGRELEMVIIVGVPYPEPNVKLYAQRRYYAYKYGEDKAFEYTATIPAMRKVNQAIGRLVRRPDDYGVALLMDERYTRLRRYLVNWMRVKAQVHYGDTDQLLRVVSGLLRELRLS